MLLPCQNFGKPNSFRDICEKLLSDPYVLLLLMLAMFVIRSKIKTYISSKNTLRNIYIKRLVLIGPMVTEERILEKLLMITTTDDYNIGCQVMAIIHMTYGQVSYNGVQGRIDKLMKGHYALITISNPINNSNQDWISIVKVKTLPTLSLPDISSVPSTLQL